MKSVGVSGKVYVCLFAIYALLSSLVVVWKLPPFMGADEFNHLKRANQISRGEFVAERARIGSALVAGGDCEAGLAEAESYYRQMQFHPEIKMNSVDLDLASTIGWGNRLVKQPFDNTAAYPPIFYLPQSLAIGICKGLGVSVIATITATRVANALACIVMGCFALLLVGRARLVLFTFLLLPMSIALYSTVTQDGLLLVTAALGCALMVRGISERREISRGELWGASLCLALVGMAKPPYVLFSLLLLLVKSDRKVLAAALAILVGAVWNVLMTAFVQMPLPRAGMVIDAGAQASYLAHHPFAFFSVMAHTAHGYGEFAAQFIGVLGWLDTLLPKPYYALAFLVLLLTWWIDWSVKGDEFRGRPLVTLVVLGLTKLGVFAALYLAYTPVGGAAVDGVQGRYFLPVAAFLPMALVGSLESGDGRLRRFGTYLALAFPLSSMAVTYHALVVRFYG